MVVLPGRNQECIVSNPGQFTDGKGPYFKKYIAFQSNPKDAAIRIFVDENAGLIKGATYLDVLGQRHSANASP
jgi:hypothetical protein